jgi:hypothetical protein
VAARCDARRETLQERQALAIKTAEGLLLDARRSIRGLVGKAAVAADIVRLPSVTRS